MLPKAKHLKHLFSLDLGTTKFCLATLREVPGQEGYSVATVSVPADGMRRGMLANIEQAKAALRTLLELAEKEFGTDISRVVVGVAGSHLGSRVVSATRLLDGPVVTSQDLLTLMEQVEAEQPSDGRELLHTVPIGYRVDARETIDDPRGFRGKSLTGEFFLIDADKYYMKDIVDVCNDSGLQVVRLYSEPFASASVTVPDAFKQLGVAMADIGGGTTDGLVFKGGRPVFAFTVNVAGKLMTNDLAIGLSLSHEVAETVKLRFGVKPRPGDQMTVMDIRGTEKLIGETDTNPVLLPRLQELSALLARELYPHRGALGAGLLLTGGGADVIGITEYFQSRLHIPVARARPMLSSEDGGVSAEAALARSPHPTKFATVIGLLNLEIGRLGDLEKTRKASWTNRYIGQFFNWIRELS